MTSKERVHGYNIMPKSIDPLQDAGATLRGGEKLMNENVTKDASCDFV
jgi:hypothetical protein